ncbi:MAG TPA: ECF transporter S component [Chloroflexota bacterium]|nr:ECF transporter S component [Chloroflexota bacterium]
MAATAIMTAVVTVFTAAIQVRNPASGGYFNLSDVAIIFASVTFGPWIGLVAGGLGTAIADLILGYAQFAPLSFIAHGGEGLIAGLIAVRRPSWLVVAWIAGVAWMMAAYFVGEVLMFGAAQATADLLGTNWIQALAGVLGLPLYYAVRAAYPPITRLREGRTWREI